MKIIVDLYFSPIDALQFNINNIEDETKTSFENMILDDDYFWQDNIVSVYNDDPDLIDSCIECIQEQDIDTIWKYIKLDRNSLEFEDYESENFLKYNITVYWDFDSLCEKVFHQTLHK